MRHKAREKAAAALVKLLVILALAWLLSYMLGCGSPTGPTELTPNEEQAISFVSCFSKRTNRGEARTSFSETTREYPVEACRVGTAIIEDGIIASRFMTDNGECVAAAWALLESNTVVFWREWVNDPKRTRYHLRETSAHEVVHVSFYISEHSSVFKMTLQNILTIGGCE